MIKELITKLFDIETYESEYAAVSKELALLKHEFDIYAGANDVLAHKVVDLEDRVEVLTQDPDKYVWQKLSEYKDEYTDRIRNSAFAEGRMCAYSEMGIWRLDALERGNALVRLPDGDIVELICDDLVDVYEGSERVARSDVLDDEIIIDDLIEVSA